jgi:hypothetical protein
VDTSQYMAGIRFDFSRQRAWPCMDVPCASFHPFDELQFRRLRPQIAGRGGDTGYSKLFPCVALVGNGSMGKICSTFFRSSRSWPCWTISNFFFQYGVDGIDAVRHPTACCATKDKTRLCHCSHHTGQKRRHRQLLSAVMALRRLATRCRLGLTILVLCIS